MNFVALECLERLYEVKKLQVAKQKGDPKKGLEYFVGEDGLPFETTKEVEDLESPENNGERSLLFLQELE